MTNSTPTTQREADERAMFSQDDVIELLRTASVSETNLRTLYAGHALSLKLEHLTVLANKARTAIDQSTRQAGPIPLGISAYADENGQTKGSYQQAAPEAKPVARVTKQPGCFDLESLIADDKWPEGVTDLYASPVAAPEAPAAATVQPSAGHWEPMGKYAQRFVPDQPSAGQVDEPVRYEIRLVAPSGAFGSWDACDKDRFEKFKAHPDVGDGFTYEVRALYTRASLTPTAPQAAPETDKE